MLEGASILSFAVDQWTDVPRCRHHVLSRLAVRNRVLFTSSPWYVRDVLRRGRARAPALMRISDNLHTYTPPRWLPYTYRFPRVDGVMRKLRAVAIEHVLDRLAMARPILYIWHPSFADVIGQFDVRAVVYHCYDEYAAFAGADRSRVAEDEARILAAADVVVTVSEALYARKRAFNANTHLVRNGVDYALFASAQNPSLDLPVEVRDLPRPVIGCVTRIVPESFDAELLHDVFSRRPEWSFVVVGPECATSSPESQAALSALKKLPNVHLLGRRGLTELPSYLKAFDACLIPYVLTGSKGLGDPLKVYEYLAAGKPIVSKPLAALAPFGDLVSAASTADEWIEAIEHAVHDHSPERVAQRQAIARQNTWDDRVERIARLIAAASMG